MYKLKVEDFVNLTQIDPIYDVNDMICVCKRENNPKRDYLFVNKYQGKYIPAKPSNILKMFEYFYQKIKKNLNLTDKTIIMAFAETATAIGQYIYQRSIEDKLNIVYYLQTTREKMDEKYNIIKFKEEHSHATNQTLYSKKPLPEFDRILFINDEITTGNTILNFISEFEKTYPNKNYSVASILNWQNKENQEKFKNIQTIAIIRGELKDNISLIEVKEKEKIDFFNNNSNTQHLKKNTIKETPAQKTEFNPRYGLDKDEFSKIKLTNIKEKKYAGEKVLVLGTEENMYAGLMFAKELEDEGCNVLFVSTGRSPIVVSGEKNYGINSGIALNSNYDRNRKVFLYNIDTSCSIIVVPTETEITRRFRHSISVMFNPKQNIYIIQPSYREK